MGGRGSQGGTRSTYRGNSTFLFNQNVQQGGINTNNNGGGGGGNQGQGGANTGSIQTGGGGQGGASASTPAPPLNTPLDKFRRVAKLPETDAEVAADVKTINPGWGDPDFNIVNGRNKKSRDNVKSRINCQRCVVAHEARRKGYDVEAVDVETGWLAVPWVDATNEHNLSVSASAGDIAKLFVTASGNAPKWHWVPSDRRTTAINQLEREVKSWGEGARGIMYVTWSAKSSHVMNVEVRNGKVFYTDGQPGLSGDVLSTGNTGDNWKTQFSPSRSLGVLRVDNTEITDNGTTWMRERSNLQINAPTGVELAQHIDGKTLEEQKIWSHVWQQIRTGERVTLPSNIGNDLGKVAVAKEAAAWVRRPD